MIREIHSIFAYYYYIIITLVPNAKHSKCCYNSHSCSTYGFLHSEMRTVHEIPKNMAGSSKQSAPPDCRRCPNGQYKIPPPSLFMSIYSTSNPEVDSQDHEGWHTNHGRMSHTWDHHHTPHWKPEIIKFSSAMELKEDTENIFHSPILYIFTILHQ